MIVNMRFPKNPFRLEDLRSLYALDGKLSKLRGLYGRRYPEIVNKNTGLLWDRLNAENQKSLDNSPIFKDKLTTLLNELKSAKGKLLDIGIGRGSMEKLLLAKKSKLDLYGTDMSFKSLQYIRQNMPMIHVKKSNLNTLPFKSNFFDTVIILDVLEHISPHKVFKVYKEIRRVLKNDGILLVSVPLNEGLESMIKLGFNPNAHVRVYTERLLEAELKLAGFHILSFYKLFAFRRFYLLKKFIAQNVLTNIKLPNLVIMKVKK